ncbi:MAG: DsrE family protein [Thermodesulfovibrionales bacterium]|jgi:sulfur relay (sulfurtransferase) DsrF/TusC family protein
MGDVKLAFIVQRPQYKGETSRLAITHAISYQTVEILLEDGDTVTPKLCFIGEGVLGLQKGQNAMDLYGITSTESHMKNTLLVDLDVLVCKEDLAKYGIPEDAMPTAEDMGADKSIQVVPFSEIQKAMEEAKHVLFF